ncbi:hypothetical protein CEXT_507971 [Caerostris extrusa]|uniref:Uncharacterized protein n=1 Tax=Caerostris extrusa TaxID=172846 RepID=A0AAV4XXF6_CAEEX|nr:hypothetical protein CEXT_507971 [Caerostris extrusa]
MASDWVTEIDPPGTMGDRCPLIGTDRRRFPPFVCEEIANNFLGTWIISLSGKREKKGQRPITGGMKRDLLRASDWVTEGDLAGTMGDCCPLIGTDRRRFPPFVGLLLYCPKRMEIRRLYLREITLLVRD